MWRTEKKIALEIFDEK